MELLKNLYEIHSMSGQENAMRKFIKDYVRNNIAGALVVQDHHNLYITKGVAKTYPCVVAHLDQVQKKHSKDFKVFEYDGVLFGYSAENKRQEGLGADDKNGIWVGLKCLEHFDDIKVAFFHSEEVGTVGSGQADMSFFEDCRFVLEADRRNGGDLITDICGSICSDEFKNDIADLADAHGYKATSGMLTDVETLSDNGLGLSAINMSCGYYNPHTDEECTVVDELWNCLSFVFDIIASCQKVYTFTRKKSSWGSYGSYGSYGGYGGYEKGWWNYKGGKYDKDYDTYYDDDNDLDWRDFYGYNKSYGVTSKKEEEKVEDLPEVTVCDDEISLVDFDDYYYPEDAIYAYIERNINTYFTEHELWSYIEADCQTHGIDEAYFHDMYMDVFQDYVEDEEEEETRF